MSMFIIIFIQRKKTTFNIPSSLLDVDLPHVDSGVLPSSREKVASVVTADHVRDTSWVAYKGHGVVWVPVEGQDVHAHLVFCDVRQVALVFRRILCGDYTHPGKQWGRHWLVVFL